MADWNLPTLASTYTNYTTELDGRLDDLLLGNDPATRTLTNVPTGAIRWKSADNKWEKWNGSSWVSLTTTYAINVSTSNAWATGRTITLTGDVTGTSSSWDGSDNVSFSTTLGTVSAAKGGTGITSYSIGDIVYASGTTTLSKLAGVATGNTLISGGVGAAPSWGKVGLDTHVSGTLAVGNGGTGATSLTGIIKGNGTGAFTTLTAPSGTIVGTSDTQTLTNKTITGTKETKVALAANDIDLSAGSVFTKTVSGNTTFTVSNTPVSGTVASFVFELTNGGAYTMTWWSGMKWAGGTAPTLTSSGVDILGFYTHDGGTTWRGFMMAKDSK